MEWTDEAIVLSSRAHGENGAVVMLLAKEQGRHAGLVAGGQGQSSQALLQPGNQIRVRWRARLVEQLGHYNCEMLAPRAAGWLDNAEILSIIASASAVTEACLPERQAMPGVYAGLCALMELRDADLWAPSYVKWEMGLLRALGYGLDLSQCAANGGTDNLAYVSPRTGRAVSLEAGTPYHEKLFPLPSFLLGGEWTAEDIKQGLELTGHFLTRNVFSHTHSRLITDESGLPLARQRLLEYYSKQCEEKVPALSVCPM